MGFRKGFGVVAASLALAACSDGDGQSGTIGGPGTGGWTPDSYLPSASFKNQCANPRSGSNAQGDPFPDTQGSTLTENNWLRSWTHELYFWYDEVVDRNPSNYSTQNYFQLQKTFEQTPSGASKDRFHFTAPTDAWESFSQSGTTLGYGATFLFLESDTPREVVVLLVEPDSPAAAAGLQRGDRVVTVDGINVANTNNTAGLNAGLLPDELNETHTFGIRRGDGTENVTLTATRLSSTPVHTVSVIPTDTGPVGYILFNEHIATAETGLIDAFATLRAANVTDLVLDVRYNGGGYVDIASEAAYMIAGPTHTAGRDFERTRWNANHTTTNPVTGDPLAPIPFFDAAVGLSRPAGTPLPTLDLARVFVLTSAETCSASESIMNGLRGVDVEVIQIGSRTCGKPYGFYDVDNCGTTYFSVQFQGLNAKDFGDYTDGFTPENAAADELGTRIPGCVAADDPDHQLGDPNEHMLSVALSYRMNGECPAQPEASSKMSHAVGAAELIGRAPYRKIRQMRAERSAR